LQIAVMQLNMNEQLCTMQWFSSCGLNMIEVFYKFRHKVYLFSEVLFCVVLTRPGSNSAALR